MKAGRNKRYIAVIWVRGSDQPGKRVSVMANALSEARTLLETQYGEGNVFDLHNESDAARPR